MSNADLHAQLVHDIASIAEHKPSLKGLEGQKLAVTAEIRSGASFPVLSLPVEITTAIFAFCLPTVKELRENHEARCRDSPATLTAPNILAGCCRTWRDIAFATPFLWTTLPLCLRDEDFGTATTAHAISEGGRGRVEEYVDRWLGRAGLQPLTFVFCLEQEAEPDFDVPSPVRCMRDVIRRYSDRLQELELELTAAYFDIGILGLDSIHFPLLERATLGNTDPNQDVGDASSVFGNAPRLHEFNLRPDTWLLCYTPPWTQLTEFKGPIHDLDLFSVASNLLIAECILEASYYVARSQIVHPRLQSLALLGSYIDGLTNMLDALTLPALVSLHISLSVSLPSFLSFLARSAPSLRTLSVKVEHDGFEQWKPILYTFDATLESLQVRGPSAEFLSCILRLGLSAQSQRRLPHLQDLSILESPAVNHEQLVNFLYQRSTSNDLVRLQSFRLLHRFGTPPDEVEELIAGKYETGKHKWSFNKTNSIDPELARGWYRHSHQTRGDELNFMGRKAGA